jgi:hypothetical protein
MSKPAIKRPNTKSAPSVSAPKPSQRTVGDPKIKGTNSKQSRVLAMLQSPAGATIAAIMKTTGWQQHSVRGFLAGVVRKRLKLKLVSKKVDDHRVYQVVIGSDGKPAARRPAA